MKYKLSVWQGETSKQRPEAFLKIVEKFAGGFELIAVDKKGEPLHCGRILTIFEDGTLFRNYNVNPDLGLKLTSQGQIQLNSDGG